MGERTDVFVLRPAPIQVQFMGFCSSMGADFIDYIVTDPIASPPSTVDRLYTEKVIYMPHSYYVNDYKQSCKFVFDEDRPTRYCPFFFLRDIFARAKVYRKTSSSSQTSISFTPN